MSERTGEDPLLSDLCTICHLTPPKYRCPRCNTRTCSLPCTRRHKTWSQCSGVRDPAAYVRRNELASDPAAFDRDFNFITGIERTIERAGRDAEYRGVRVEREELDGGNSRKRRKMGDDGGAGLVKGEAGFLRGAQSSDVTVVRAPRGMTRNKVNGSRWHPKQKCLIWTVEWISPDGEKKLRTCLESCRVAEAYDRFYPLPKEELRKEELPSTDKDQEQMSEEKKDSASEAPEQVQPQPQPEHDPDPAPHSDRRPEQQPETTEPLATTSTSADPNTNIKPNSILESSTISPHRDIYFYLHRPRTATKQPVLIPLSPSVPLTTALRNRTVLEFPTIYILHDAPVTLRAEDSGSKRFMLEEEYLQSEQAREEVVDGGKVQDASRAEPDAVDLGQVNEEKVMEVLKQDLFEPVPAAVAE